MYVLPSTIDYDLQLSKYSSWEILYSPNSLCAKNTCAIRLSQDIVDNILFLHVSYSCLCGRLSEHP